MTRRPLLLAVASLALALWVATLAWLAFTGGKLTKPPRDAGARAASTDEPAGKK